MGVESLPQIVDNFGLNSTLDLLLISNTAYLTEEKDELRKERLSHL